MDNKTVSEKLKRIKDLEEELKYLYLDDKIRSLEHEVMRLKNPQTQGVTLGGFGMLSPLRGLTNNLNNHAYNCSCLNCTMGKNISN